MREAETRLTDEVVIYGARISPFVEKVVRGVALKGLSHRLAAGLRLPRTGLGTSKVPVAEIGGTAFQDSTFILRELDRRFPEPPFWSSNPVVAAAQRHLEDWSDESLYWCVFALRWATPNADATRAQLAELRGPLPRRVFDWILRRRIGSQPPAQGMGRLPYHVLLRETAARLDDLVTLLGTRPFFYARHPGAADLAVYGQLRTGSSDATPDLQDLIRKRPPLTDLMSRVEDRTGGP